MPISGAPTLVNVWGKCGVRYQTATTHNLVGGSTKSTHWSAPFYLC